jgi:hypothetical protein
MPRADHDPYPGERTTWYQFKVPTDDWEDWQDQIPRSTPLYERLYTLIQIDTALDGDTNVAQMNLLSMKCERIRQRAETGRQAIDNGDPQKARAELEQIEEVAGALAGE